MRRTRVIHTASAVHSLAALWGDRLKSATRKVYGTYRRVEMNLKTRREMTEAQRTLDPAMLDAAESDLRRMYWGQWGDGGAMAHDGKVLADMSTPEVAQRFAHLLAFCVQQDPSRKKGSPDPLPIYDQHRAAVCQSLYLMTLQQAQMLLPQHLLEFTTIEVLTRCSEAACTPPPILPSDKEAVEEVFQFWSDSANREAGVEGGSEPQGDEAEAVSAGAVGATAARA